MLDEPVHFLEGRSLEDGEESYYDHPMESLLGLRLEADKLHVAPCVPADWKSFRVHYRYRETVYTINVLQTSVADGGPRLTVDCVVLPGPAIPLVERPPTARGRDENMRRTGLTLSQRTGCRPRRGLDSVHFDGGVHMGTIDVTGRAEAAGTGWHGRRQARGIHHEC